MKSEKDIIYKVLLTLKVICQIEVVNLVREINYCLVVPNKKYCQPTCSCGSTIYDRRNYLCQALQINLKLRIPKFEDPYLRNTY